MGAEKESMLDIKKFRQQLSLMKYILALTNIGGIWIFAQKSENRRIL